MSASASRAEANAALIRARTKRAPRVAIVLGSGLGGLVDAVEESVTIPYDALDGFPVPSVSGHAGSLVLGRIGSTPVAMMAGRGHFYEHGRADVMRVALETLRALGIADLVLTNSAGGLREEAPPGSLMRISDHINLNTGKLLDRVFEQAGVERKGVYITNAVKHFKWEPRGKRRLHKTPAQKEIEACHYWLEKEIATRKPKVIVAMGATALKFRVRRRDE